MATPQSSFGHPVESHGDGPGWNHFLNFVSLLCPLIRTDPGSCAPGVEGDFPLVVEGDPGSSRL